MPSSPCTRRPALVAALVVSAGATGVHAQDATALHRRLDAGASAVEGKVIAWRRDIHQHPELSGEEVRTAGVVAAHLRALGLEVRTGVGGHGVVGVLRGAKPGPVVALRADMDALPVTEVNALPFRSTVRATYRGQQVGVMHACGHDTHVAMLMGAAEVLAGMKAQLPGSVVFVFQPAEEGTPVGGAKPMIDAGALANPKVDAIFGIHVGAGKFDQLSYRGGAVQASVDNFEIVVRGRQSHGALPWQGVDPIVVASQVVLGLQTIVSRQLDIASAPTVVTVGAIHGGVRTNIIPDSVVMIGTMRTFDDSGRAAIRERIRRTATGIATTAGGSAEVTFEIGYPVTVNHPALTRRMVPSLQRVAGTSPVIESPLVMASEDFSYFQREVPGMFFYLGVTSPDVDWRTAPGNHSPQFMVDERALVTGVRAYASLAVDFLAGGALPRVPGGASVGAR
jgi:amidohydrolase